MTQTLDAAITDALDRLGDLANIVWSRSEMALYLRDGYDLYCRRTKCLFDIYVIENLPPSGNWQTDLEKYLAQQIPGMGLTDSPFHFTNDFERNYGIDGRYGGSYSGPAAMTAPRAYADTDDAVLEAGLGIHIDTDVYSPVLGPELLTNGSVEAWTGTNPTGWAVAGTPSAGTGTLDKTTIDPIQGSYSARVNFVAATGERLIYQDLTTLAAGAAYRLSGAYRVSAATLSVELYVSDGGSNYLLSDGLTVGGASVFSSAPSVDEWHTFTYDFICPAWATVRVRFDFNASGATTGTVDWDDLKLQRIQRSAYTVDATDSIPTAAPGGLLPQSTVEVLRVTYDDRELYALGSAQARRLDPNYESRSGDPQFFTFDKDGIFFLRLIPNAQGDAVYDTVSGSWGTMTETDDTTVEIVTTEVTGRNTGGYGILRHRDDMFPTHGPWGTPTRVHPTSENTKVEVYRLGRSLDAHPFELPDAYLRYPLYWAMSRALHRDGPGQDIELADHYEQRFEMGIHRMTQKRAKMDRERVGCLGGAPTDDAFSVGWPQAPYPYQNR